MTPYVTPLCDFGPGGDSSSDFGSRSLSDLPFFTQSFDTFTWESPPSRTPSWYSRLRFTSPFLGLYRVTFHRPDPFT